MDNFYYEQIDKLEKMKVDRDYILGWIGGYLNNPPREEQRITDAYSAGYTDGETKQLTQAGDWVSA